MYLTLIGYHGTESANVENIKKNGYQASDSRNWLGWGVYFFGDLEGSIKTKGFDAAKRWVINVKKERKYAIFKAKINSNKFLDLVENNEHKKLFIEAREKIISRSNQQNRDCQNLKDYIVFKLIEEKSEFDFIRALVDAGRQYYESAIITIPQIQICVRNNSCILNSKLFYEES